MTRQKDLKRVVRARMKKTGEAYTAARKRIIEKPGKKAAAEGSAAVAKPATASAAPSGDYAALAGMSDAVISEKTGRTWARWVDVLDRHGASSMAHRNIAALVNETYQVDGWWSQTVTVGYERIKGLRAKGQRRDGTYEANKSRTFDVPVSTLFHAWADARERKRWLNNAKVSVRTATASKSMRLGWPGGGIVAVGFTAKGASRSAVAVQHTKLPDRQSADRLKQYWSERLDALSDLLARP
jgi:uncharacterized protein YndB with AHSA1/START domain